MAFLTRSQLQADLPNGFDTRLVDRLLVKLEADFNTRDFVFSDPGLTDKKLEAEIGYSQSIFEFGPATNLTTLILKSYDLGTLKELTLNIDYKLTKHYTLPGYFYQLTLLRNIWRRTPTATSNYNQYLELTGKFGYYFDLAATNPDLPTKLLKSVITDFVIKNLKLASSDQAQIMESKIGDVSVKFRESKSKEYYACIFDDPDFQTELNYFL